MENNSYSSYITTLVNYTKEKAKKTLYLVLIKKPLSAQSLENLNTNIESKLSKFLDKIIPKLNEQKPKDPEKFLKYMMLKATFKILAKIMDDNYMKMTEEDRIAARKIYGNGDYDDEEDEKKK